MHRLVITLVTLVQSGALMLYPGGPGPVPERVPPPAELIRTLWLDTEAVFAPKDPENDPTLRAMTRLAGESGPAQSRAITDAEVAAAAEERIADLYAQTDDQISYFMFVLSGWRAALDKHLSLTEEIRLEVDSGAEADIARLRGCVYSYGRLLAEYAYLAGQWSAGLSAWDEMMTEVNGRLERLSVYLGSRRAGEWGELFGVLSTDSLSARADVDARLRQLHSALRPLGHALAERRDRLGLAGPEWEVQLLEEI
ncbi:MAG: hypothetical protein MOGMAGMI_01704 [Candidatus Omnitrophica bacterium]|nr:hypothetical protein [Candidatus Omnitrophota bacterium]